MTDDRNRDIPGAFRAKFTVLDLEVIDLHFALLYFSQLFGNPETVDVLRRPAPIVFRHIQRTMVHSIILALRRLVDPPRSGGHDNVSLLSLAEDVEDDESRNVLTNAHDELTDVTHHLKQWRDRKLAHNDLTFLTNEKYALQAVRNDELARAAEIVADCLNYFYGRYGNRTVLYENCVSQKDGDSLLFYLRYGLHSWEEDRINRDFSLVRKLREQSV